MSVHFNRAQLERRLFDEAPNLARRVLGTFLGRHFDGGSHALHHQAGDTRVVVHNGGQRWQVSRRGQSVEGTGVIGLIASLYDVSPGTAARHVLEAATLTRLPAEIAHAVQVAIDAGGVAAGGRMTR